MEALKISLKDPLPNMAIKYQVHVQNKGWMDLKAGGEIAGTIGESLRIEAIKIKLEGAPEGYRVRYQAYVEGYGWMDQQQDGEIAGTIGKGLRIEAIKIDVDKYRYAYKYDAAGNLAYVQDVVNGVSYKYIYDLANRLVAVEDSKGNNLSYGYDANNQMSNYSEKIQGSTYGTNYSYDGDGKPKTISYYRNNPINITFNYDKVIGRLENKIINTGVVSYKTGYQYIQGANGQKTTKVESISNGIDGGASNTIAYSYYDNGNIETITENGKIIKYIYNSLNELERENNQVLNKTIVYSYDNGGNILTKTEYPYTTGDVGIATKAYSYVYNDPIWKDKLKFYEGQEITYDAIGNPKTYKGDTYNWESGRQLASITGTNKNIAFKYNDSGIRTEKTVSGVTTTYKLVGDKVTFERSGTDSMYYTYDSEDNLVSVTMNGAEYYYIRNAQGDIIGLIDKNGAQVVSYLYDSWGKSYVTDAEKNDSSDPVKDGITGTMANTVGVKNPYRYRGYRYDTETQLYYLQSRYYNPEWGRFINADGILGEQGKLLSYNMFAYSLNNPVNMVDPDGRFAIFAAIVAAPFIVTAILAVAIALTAVYTYYTVVKPLASNISDLIARSDSSANSQPKSETNTKKKKKAPRFKRSEPGRPTQGEHEITPSTNHKTTKSEPPIEGQSPNSSIDKLSDNGEIIRRRFFDDLGRAQRDVDFTNHGNPTQHPVVPHVHTWDWFK